MGPVEGPETGPWDPLLPLDATLNPWTDFTFLDGSGILGMPSSNPLKEPRKLEVLTQAHIFSQICTNEVTFPASSEHYDSLQRIHVLRLAGF